MRLLCFLTLTAALGAAGCGATNDSAADFQGAEGQVANVVDEISAAARAGEAERICNELLTEELADSLADGDRKCAAELDTSLDDVDSYSLEVQDVTISGDTATARVRGDDGGKQRVSTFRFERVGGSWRAAGIS